MAEHGLAELRAEIEHTDRRLEAVIAKLAHARRESIPAIGRNDDSALIVAGYLETYYTTLETLFVRVSQHFENSLPRDRWHSALLEKMALSIPGLRAPLVGAANLSRLRELMRFRHFRRYYLEMDWNWRRLDFLLDTLDAAHPSVLEDTRAFATFLSGLEEAAGP